MDDLKARLTGRVKEFVPATRIVTRPDGSTYEEPVLRALPDGTTQQEWIEKEVQKQKLGIVNDAGADYIVHHLEEFLNPHVSMADINTNKEAAQLAADEALSIFSHIAYNADTYGCAMQTDKLAGFDYWDFSPLENEFDTVMRQLYLYFTSLTRGGIREFGKVTTSSNYNQSSSSNETENKGMFNLRGK